MNRGKNPEDYEKGQENFLTYPISRILNVLESHSWGSRSETDIIPFSCLSGESVWGR